MTREEATAALGALSLKLDPNTASMADGITEMLNNPAFPMLMRCQAMATVIGGAAEGLASVTANDPDGFDINRVQLIERLPDIIATLKCCVDLLEDANKVRQH